MWEPPDTFYLSSAVGWLELGNPAEANAELDRISPQLRATPEVLSVRLSLAWTQKKWLEAESFARELVQLQPEVSSHWTSLAYAARRKPEGSIDEAKAILLKASELFPQESLICYNLSCYEAQLGSLATAQEWLEKAYVLGGKKEIQRMAAEDPDLEPLRKAGVLP